MYFWRSELEQLVHIHVALLLDIKVFQNFNNYLSEELTFDIDNLKQKKGAFNFIINSFCVI